MPLFTTIHIEKEKLKVLQDRPVLRQKKKQNDPLVCPSGGKPEQQRTSEKYKYKYLFGRHFYPNQLLIEMSIKGVAQQCGTGNMSC